MRLPPTPPTSSLPADVANGDVAKRAIRARADLSAMLLGYDLDPGPRDAHARGLPRGA